MSVFGLFFCDISYSLFFEEKAMTIDTKKSGFEKTAFFSVVKAPKLCYCHEDAQEGLGVNCFWRLLTGLVPKHTSAFVQPDGGNEEDDAGEEEDAKIEPQVKFPCSQNGMVH